MQIISIIIIPIPFIIVAKNFTKGVVSLQASCDRGGDVQGILQGYHQEGEIFCFLCGNVSVRVQGFHQKCELQDIFTFNVFHLSSLQRCSPLMSLVSWWTSSLKSPRRRRRRKRRRSSQSCATPPEPSTCSWRLSATRTQSSRRYATQIFGRHRSCFCSTRMVSKSVPKHRHRRNVTSHHSLSHLSLLYFNLFNFHH